MQTTSSTERVAAGGGSRDFTRLWISGTVSLFGTAVTTVALPIVALLTLRASTFEVGLISAAGLIAWLLIGLSVGVWVEHLPRRPVLILCDLARAAALASVPVAAAAGVLTIAQLVAVALVVGIGAVFFDVASQTFLPSLVRRPALLASNSKLQAANTAANTAGQATSGGLIQVLGAPLTFVVDVLSYLVSATFLLSIKHREPPVERGARRRMLPQIREGLAFVWQDPLIRPLALVAASLNLVGAAFDTLMVPFLLRTVSVSPAAIGLLVALSGVGGVIGAALGGPVVRRLGGSRAVLVAAFAGPPFALLVPWTSLGVALVFVAVGLIGREIGIQLFSLLARSYRQATAPPGILARVTASIRFISWGVLPIGALAGGLLGEATGNRAAMWCVCLALLLTPLPIVFPLLRQRRVFLAGLDAIDGSRENGK